MAFRDQLREPGVINMAAQVASFDARVPKTREKNEERKRQNSYEVSAAKDEGSGNREMILGTVEVQLRHQGDRNQGAFYNAAAEDGRLPCDKVCVLKS